MDIQLSILVCWWAHIHLTVLSVLRFGDLFTRIGDEGLIAIGQCHSLCYLNISGCHQVGDAGIIAVARGCPQLSYLDVSVLQVHHVLS